MGNNNCCMQPSDQADQDLGDLKQKQLRTNFHRDRSILQSDDSSDENNENRQRTDTYADNRAFMGGDASLKQSAKTRSQSFNIGNFMSGSGNKKKELDKQSLMEYLLKLTSEQNVMDDQKIRQEVGEQIDLDNWSVIKIIGMGAMSKVYLVEHQEIDLIESQTNFQKGQRYAMKVIEKQNFTNDSMLRSLKLEQQVLQNTEHPFILTLRYSFETSTHYFLIVEYLNGGDLFKNLKKKANFSESEARHFAAQIILALEHLHSQNIIYRDLKPENVLVDKDGYIKLSDFGISKQIKNSQDLTNTMVGTPEYIAPEMFNTSQGYGVEVDIWSLGCLLYELVSGQPPFRDTFVNSQQQSINPQRLREMIVTEDIQLKKYFSKQFSLLLEGLCAKNVKGRLTLNQVKSHPFFRKIQWEELLQVKQDQWVPRNPSSIMGSLRESTVLPPVLGDSTYNTNPGEQNQNNNNMTSDIIIAQSNSMIANDQADQNELQSTWANF